MGGLSRDDPRRFVPREAYERNLKNQLAMTPRTLAELTRLGMATDAVLSLEYFFYTDRGHRAEELAKALRGLGYSAEARLAAGDRSLFLVTGWTTPISMNEPALLQWTEAMAERGFQHDCDFDGWGTHAK